MIHTKKDTFWTDESGTKIPIGRVTKHELMKEASLAKVAKHANELHARIAAFKANIQAEVAKIIEDFKKEKAIDSIGKGNVTIFNFDRTIKVSLDINDRIEFDDITMKACKEKFDQFLNSNIDEKQAFVKELVNDAFSTSRGKLDAKKVMSLLKYETRIHDEMFQGAITLLKDSIRRPDSKAYYRIWVKDGSGEYQNIDLNFSSI